MTRVATGSSRSRSAATASGASSESPCLLTPTGSTTTGTPTRPSTSATAATSAVEASMPVFTASTPMSDSTLSSWARTASAGSSQ